MVKRSRLPFLTFRLRTLLVLIGILCALLAWRVHQVRSRELALEAMRSAEADIGYEDEPVIPPYCGFVPLREIRYMENSGRGHLKFSNWRTDESGSNWSRKMRLFIFGDPNQIYYVLLDAEDGAEEETLVARQEPGRIDNALQRLPALAEIGHLDLDRSPASESALNSIGRLGNLERLYLVGTQTSDKTLMQIGGLTKLQWLAVGSPHVTARGLKDLAALKNLLWLELNECTFGDEGVDELRHLKGLRQLALPTTVSDVATQHLRELLPECNIVRGDPRELNSSGIPVRRVY